MPYHNAVFSVRSPTIKKYPATVPNYPDGPSRYERWLARQLLHDHYQPSCAPGSQGAESGKTLHHVLSAQRSAEFLAKHKTVLLQDSEWPQWDRIEAHNIVPAIKELAKKFRAEFAEFEKSLTQNASPTFADIFPPLNNMGRRLVYVMKQASHLNEVMASDPLEKAVLEAQEIVVEINQLSKQSEALYRALTTLKGSPEWFKLDPAQRRIVDANIKGMQLGGIALSGEARARYNEIDVEMTQIVTRFRSNATKSKKTFELVITGKDELSGLSAEDLQALASNYNSRKKLDKDDPNRATAEDGPWMITLDDSSYLAIVNRADNRALRQKLFETRRLIASAKNPYDGGQFDNTGLAKQILQLSQEQAKLLGYPNYASLSQSQKMMGTVEAANEFMETLLARAQPFAKREDQKLQEYAEGLGFAEKLKPWDKAYFLEKMQKEEFGFNDQTMKSYLSLPKVIGGVIAIVQKLFDVDIVDHTGEVPAYHKDVKFFKVHDRGTGSVIAAFYYDPYERSGLKRSGAWMDDFVSYRVDEKGDTVQIPIALLTTNFQAPIDGKPARLTLRDAETLIHELGHGLQHMLTKVPHENAAGINAVEWDAVEIASQQMEYWIYLPETLRQISSHIDSGESFPDDLIKKIRDAKTFWAANDTLRQLLLAMTDMALYSQFDPNQNRETIYDVYQRVYEKIYGDLPVQNDFFLNSFLHIFGGGYQAGYISYKVAEMLAADYYSAFEPFLNNPGAIHAIGQKLKETLYEMGGGAHPRDVFRAFMGRDYSIEALLRHYGLEQ